MTTLTILQQPIRFNRFLAYRQHARPNVFHHLMLRTGLGLFMAFLPLLFFRFMVNFAVTAQTGTFSQEWQVLWAGHLSTAFVMAMFTGVRIGVIIRLISMKQGILQKYGRLVGRICTIGATGISIIVPYMVFIMAQESFLIPTFLLACFVPVMSFIVVRSATKDYLLRVRIWFDRYAE